MAKLTDEQREEIRETRSAQGQEDPRKYRREQKKLAKLAARYLGLGRQRAHYTSVARDIKPKTRGEKQAAIQFAIKTGDLATISRDLWLRAQDEHGETIRRRTIPRGSIVILQGMHIWDGSDRNDFAKNKCQIFFEGLIYNYAPMSALRPIGLDDDDDDED